MSTGSGNGLVPPGNESLLGPVLTMIPDVIQVITAYGCIKGRTNRKSGMEKTNGDNEDFISHDDIIKWKLFRVTGLLWREAGNIMVYRNHYSDVIMGVMASQITSLTIVYSSRSKKTSKLRVTGLCAGNSPVTGEFPARRASNAEYGSIWWHHHMIAHSGPDPILPVAALK